MMNVYLDQRKVLNEAAAEQLEKIKSRPMSFWINNKQREEISRKFADKSLAELHEFVTQITVK